MVLILCEGGGAQAKHSQDERRACCCFPHVIIVQLAARSCKKTFMCKQTHRSNRKGTVLFGELTGRACC